MAKNDDSEPTGLGLLLDSTRNKGLGFSAEERDRFGLRGLLPPHVSPQAEQVARTLENFRRKPDDLERFIYLNAMRERNEKLFYRVLIDHLELMMPVIYTPTVGLVCQRFSHIFRQPQGLFVSSQDRGRVREVLANWPADDVRIVVVTDGERILGLGDLGACGMGIPVGKLALYTACAGTLPSQCLPVCLDVGTNNAAFLHDPFYVGLRQRRVEGDEYDALFEEFLDAVLERYPAALIQLEDFATTNAIRLLRSHRDRVALFDDDIQGTAAVALAGLYAAMRITGATMADQRLLLLGAGEAGTGIAELVVSALMEGGMTEGDARRRCWLFDTAGLVVAGRARCAVHKRPFAHRHEPIDNFVTAIETLRPTAIIGASGQGGLFTQAVVEAMSRINERPVVFALSNPTSRSECTAEQAYRWSRGRAVFASGSPFDPVVCDGRRFVPGQGNNAYIFPGVGFGAVFCGATRITDDMFLAAAAALADRVTDADLAEGRVYPPLGEIRDVSLDIAAAVARVAYDNGLAREARPADLRDALARRVYDPHY